ncbi:MAG: DUF6737 family protein [Microcystaceae cyanobacterium]
MTNLWQSKPWWCQPWTIVLTGLTAIALSWFIFHRLWLTIPLGLLIGVWWTYFLILLPRLIEKHYTEKN